MSSQPLSGASPPRKVAEYDSVAAYRAGQGVLAAAAEQQFQAGDKLIVIEANGKQWTELWRNGQRVGTF
jgi:hypothetical protein